MVREVVWNKKVLESFDEIIGYLEEYYFFLIVENFLISVFECIDKLSWYLEIGRRIKCYKIVW